MIQKKTLDVKGLRRSFHARHLLFNLKQETGRECYLHPHHLLLGKARNHQRSLNTAGNLDLSRLITLSSFASNSDVSPPAAGAGAAAFASNAFSLASTSTSYLDIAAPLADFAAVPLVAIASKINSQSI